jgi:polyhydroxyalkanoate synthesis regulator phasin
MIHEASTIAAGDARALRRQSELLEGISAEIAGIYAERTGNDAKSVRKMMMEETWMNADEAKNNGFVDSVLKDGREFDKNAQGMTGILAKLFPGNDEAAKIEAAIIENDSLRADLDAANKQISELQNLAEVNATLQADLSTAQATIAELQAKAEESAAVAADLEKAAIINEQKVAEKASELLASTGHPEPVAVAEASEEPTLREKYAKLTTPTERAAFRKAHWENLIQH